MRMRRNKTEAPDSKDQQVRDDWRVGEAARLLVLAQTGVSLNPESVDAMTKNLDAVRVQHGVGPDAIQDALFTHEPMLALRDMG